MAVMRRLVVIRSLKEEVGSLTAICRLIWELQVWLTDAAAISQLLLCSGGVFFPVYNQPQEMVSEENRYSSKRSDLSTIRT